MSGNDAPEAVEYTASYPEAVWNHQQDPKSYASAPSLQQQPIQQYKQSFPCSQTSSPHGGYGVASSNAFGGGVNGNGVGSKKRNRTICGISRGIFIALAIMAVVFIAAAIGGGVGGSMAVKSVYEDGAKGASDKGPAPDASSSPTVTAAATISATGTTSSGASTATSTAEGFYMPPTEGVQLALDCPRLNGDKVAVRYRDDYEASFTLACGTDKIGRDFDLFGATVYTYTDCMRLCVSYNIERHTTDCQGVSFAADAIAPCHARTGHAFAKFKLSVGKQDPDLEVTHALGAVCAFFEVLN
ncbi:hypothetical protein PG985_010317 [Apiospora marii]|uniref:uncharacterized protein n=1 Tax=Apiospora marii TaxID=335849 RepID=UPI0031310BAA